MFKEWSDTGGEAEVSRRKPIEKNREGGVLTEAQLQALERVKEKRSSG